MKYDILSLGPARMDVFLKLPDVEVDEVCSIDRKRCVIELGFGEKIALRGVEFAIGGNAEIMQWGYPDWGFPQPWWGQWGTGGRIKRLWKYCKAKE